MTEAEIAWVAGLIEGEGSMVLLDKGAGRIKIAMNDEDVIRRIHSVTGVGTVCQLSNRGKPMWCWQVNKRSQVPELIKLLLPWLGERRSKRANELLKHHRPYGWDGTNRSRPTDWQRKGTLEGA